MERALYRRANRKGRCLVLNCDGKGKPNNESRPVPRERVEFQNAVMPLDNAVNHCQTQAGSFVVLSREKRLETALPNLLGHAGSSITDANDGAVIFHRGLESYHSAIRHGVDGIKDKISQCFAESRFVTSDRRNWLE